MISTDPFYFALLGVAAILGSMIGAISGFGGGLVITPFLVPIVGVTGVVPVMTVAMIIGNAMRLWVFRSHVQPRFIGSICIAVVPGIVIGTTIYDMLSPRVVSIVLGLFLLASIPMRRLVGKKPLHLSNASTALVGFGFGTLTGATTGAGVIMLSLLLGMGLSGPALVATDAAVGVLANVTKALMFGGFNVLDRDRLFLGLALGACTIPGAYLGRWLVSVVPMHVHIGVIEALVACVGVWFLYHSLVVPG